MPTTEREAQPGRIPDGAPARCPLTPPAWRAGCWGFFVHREPPDRPLRCELSAKHDRRWSTCAARNGKVAGPATRVSRAVVALASPSASLASGTGRKYCAGRRPGRGAGHRTDDVRTATHRPAASRGRRPSRHGLDQSPRATPGSSRRHRSRIRLARPERLRPLPVHRVLDRGVGLRPAMSVVIIVDHPADRRYGRLPDLGIAAAFGRHRSRARDMSG